MATSPITPPTDNPLLDHPLIKAAFAAGQQHAQNNTGVSNPPDGGAVRSILPPQQEAHAMPPIQDPTAHPAVPPIGMHPQQQAGLQTESPHVSSTILPPPTTSAAPAGSMQAPPPLAGPARGTIPGEEAETQRLIQTGSGASQIKNPIGRTLAEIGSGVEHIVAPGLARVTPGTEDRNQNLIQQSERNTGLLQGAQKNDTANTEQQAQTGLIQANTGKTQEETSEMPAAAAQKERLEDAQITNLLHPQAKTDFEAWRQQNPNAPAEDWLRAQQLAKAQHPERPDTPEQQYIDEYQKTHPGGSIAAAEKQYAQDTKIPPQLQTMVFAPNPAGGMTAQAVRPGSTIAPGSVTAGGMSTETVNADKQTAAQTKATADAKKEYQIAEQLVAHPSPTNDVALIMRYIGATKPESLGKLRLNNNEIGLVTSTRDTLGDLDAMVQKVQNGEKLVPKQRQDMLNTMKLLATAGEQPSGQQSGPPAGATHIAKGSDGQMHYTNSKGEDLGVKK